MRKRRRLRRVDIVEVANPLSEEASVMRTSLIPSMLDMLARNLNYGNADVRLFEFGNAYEKMGEKAEQHRRASMGATGNAVPGDVHEKPRPYTFFDMKGDIETLLSAFQYDSLYFDSNTAEPLSSGAIGPRGDGRTQDRAIRASASKGRR